MFSSTSMDRYELAWAAGFFDGEGWTNQVRHGRGDRTRPYGRINQAGANGIPETLIRFRAAIGGLGRIGGPYVEAGRIDLYRWEVSSLGDVELLHHLLLPWLGQLKLIEFGNALQRTAARSRSVAATDEWRAWAAGFYDGEGSTCLLPHRSHQGHVIGEIAVTQSGVGDRPEVLQRLATILDVGDVYGPYRQRGATMDIYRLKVRVRADITRAIAVMWPWLGVAKRAQAQRVLEALNAQTPLPRGNPAWGNNKTHCVNGHEYATSRIRPFVARNGGTEPRASSACLACLREYARQQRQLKKDRPAVDDDHRSISELATSYRYLLK